MRGGRQWLWRGSGGRLAGCGLTATHCGAPVDRVEAVAVAALAVVFLAAAPVAALTAGHIAYHMASRSRPTRCQSWRHRDGIDRCGRPADRATAAAFAGAGPGSAGRPARPHWCGLDRAVRRPAGPRPAGPKAAGRLGRGLAGNRAAMDQAALSPVLTPVSARTLRRCRRVTADRPPTSGPPDLRTRLCPGGGLK